jgi:transcriptional regulator with GAF, ATPase, and Fis domain
MKSAMLSVKKLSCHNRTVDFNDENMDDRERVIAALEQSGWVQAKAARLLNMTPRQIAYRIQTLRHCYETNLINDEY